MANASRYRAPTATFTRADVALCLRGLATSRAKAQELIGQGRVRADGAVLAKPSAPIAADKAIEVLPGRDFVSRGGRKLDHALDDLGVDARRRVVVDIGASTGGFTDAVLRRGARLVYAIDVGRGQLDDRLAHDSRVVIRDGTNARSLTARDFAEPIDLVVVDASFISMDKLAPALARLLRDGGELVALVKPQFEVGRDAARRARGVVRDGKLRESAIEAARTALVAMGFSVLGECDSRVQGKKGNVERFVWARMSRRL